MRQRERDRLTNEQRRPLERIPNHVGKAISAAACRLGGFLCRGVGFAGIPDVAVRVFSDAALISLACASGFDEIASGLDEIRFSEIGSHLAANQHGRGPQ